ncbi:MFS transporter [Terrabacter aerolatus]|uniref:MFS transporter n=1 Tax=Terrabacter aerolatus TaxID=422442 RepID=A0A512D455_9MICO|nr:MFS transporter [Terrabacter aerolatus]GEO31246.1 MFS transporter [Terrabacter aerolatus]
MEPSDDRRADAGRRAPGSAPGGSRTGARPEAGGRDGAGASGGGDVPEGGRPADFRQPRRTTAANATRAVGRGLGRAASGTARLTARSGRFAAGKAHAYTHSGGAGETGLARMTELHASHTAGDTIMTLALAGTLFFNPQTAQARSDVATFLLLTMVPFVLVAPLIGPLLDRFSHGRRWAIGTTLALRAFLCWVLGEAITTDSSWLFPAALGCLVASRAYTITRAAAVPRLLPPGTTLVKANSRVSMAGVVGAVAGGALGGAAMVAGSAWALRLAFVVFVVGTVQAIRLPARVDSSLGEVSIEDTAPIPLRSTDPRGGTGSPQPASSLRGTRRGWSGSPAGRHTPSDGDALTVDSLGPLGRFRRRKQAIPWPVMHAMWSTGGTRVLTGFLILFMAFLAKEHPIDGIRGEVVLAIIAVAIGIGNGLGSVVGNVVHDQRPERIAMLSVLAATACCIATGIWYGVWTLALLGFVQGLSAQLSKLCFDALVQREVPENVRTSVFAWSETMLQVLWVVGGALGIVLPLDPHVGFPVCAVVLVWTVAMAVRQRRRATPTARPRARPA